MRRSTKTKEFLKRKQSKRIWIPLNYKHETHTVTGVAINKNGKPINRISINNNPLEIKKSNWFITLFHKLTNHKFNQHVSNNN